MLAQVGLVSALGTARVPGMFSAQLPAREVLLGVPRTRSRARSREDVGYVAVYSKSDGIVQLAAPASTRRPTSSSRSRASHCGMGVNAQAFLAVADALHRFRGDDVLLADDLPRAA